MQPPTRSSTLLASLVGLLLATLAATPARGDCPRAIPPSVVAKITDPTVKASLVGFDLEAAIRQSGDQRAALDALIAQNQSWEGYIQELSQPNVAAEMRAMIPGIRDAMLLNDAVIDILRCRLGLGGTGRESAGSAAPGVSAGGAAGPSTSAAMERLDRLFGSARDPEAASSSSEQRLDEYFARAGEREAADEQKREQPEEITCRATFYPSAIEDPASRQRFVVQGGVEPPLDCAKIELSLRREHEAGAVSTLHTIEARGGSFAVSMASDGPSAPAEADRGPLRRVIAEQFECVPCAAPEGGRAYGTPSHQPQVIAEAPPAPAGPPLPAGVTMEDLAAVCPHAGEVHRGLAEAWRRTVDQKLLWSGLVHDLRAEAQELLATYRADDASARFAVALRGVAHAAGALVGHFSRAGRAAGGVVEAGARCLDFGIDRPADALHSFGHVRGQLEGHRAGHSPVISALETLGECVLAEVLPAAAELLTLAEVLEERRQLQAGMAAYREEVQRQIRRLEGTMARAEARAAEAEEQIDWLDQALRAVAYYCDSGELSGAGLERLGSGG